MNSRLITLVILLAATSTSGLSAQRFSRLSGSVVD